MFEVTSSKDDLGLVVDDQYACETLLENRYLKCSRKGIEIYVGIYA